MNRLLAVLLFIPSFCIAYPMYVLFGLGNAIGWVIPITVFIAKWSINTTTGYNKLSLIPFIKQEILTCKELESHHYDHEF